MDESESSYTELKTSKYNSALQQIMRLDLLLKHANFHSRMGDFEHWNQDLDAIWRELTGDFDDESPYEKVFQQKFIASIVSLLPLKSFLASGFNPITSNDKERYTKQYIILMDKEKWLRRLQNKLGKGTAYEESIDEYMD